MIGRRLDFTNGLVLNGAVNGEQSQKSHVGTWVTVVIGLPLFYLLSFPWLSVLMLGTHPFDYGRLHPSDHPLFAIYAIYAIPQDWLFLHTPLRRPMAEYAAWCDEVMGV